MRPAHALWLLGLSIALSGCALVEDTGRNFHVAVATPFEERREKARNQQWAEEAWQTVCNDTGASAHSIDFAQGFKDGFAEYLFRGGDGELPLAAPLRYRDVKYQNPQGYQAIQDWFEGYRLGAARAHDSGARKWITGPPVWHQEAPVASTHDVGAAKLGGPEPEDQPRLQPPQFAPSPAINGEQKPAPMLPGKLENLPTEAPQSGPSKSHDVVPEPAPELQPATSSDSLKISVPEPAPDQQPVTNFGSLTIQVVKPVPELQPAANSGSLTIHVVEPVPEPQPVTNFDRLKIHAVELAPPDAQ
jgi:hypothetical protein